MTKSILVTVGSTCFPALTDFITRIETLTELFKLGVREVTVQYGTNAPKLDSDTKLLGNFPKVVLFGYTDDLSSLMKSATVVVSHAGAGTILEAVDMRKQLIVVVNSTLMDDHQTELARAMSSLSCCEVVSQARLSDDLLPSLQKVLQLSNEDLSDCRPPIRVQGIFASIVSQEAATAMTDRSKRSYSSRHSK